MSCAPMSSFFSWTIQTETLRTELHQRGTPAVGWVQYRELNAPDIGVAFPQTTGGGVRAEDSSSHR